MKLRGLAYFLDHLRHLVVGTGHLVGWYRDERHSTTVVVLGSKFRFISAVLRIVVNL